MMLTSFHSGEMTYSTTPSMMMIIDLMIDILISASLFMINSYAYFSAYMAMPIPIKIPSNT